MDSSVLWHILVYETVCCLLSISLVKAFPNPKAWFLFTYFFKMSPTPLMPGALPREQHVQWERWGWETGLDVTGGEKKCSDMQASNDGFWCKTSISKYFSVLAPVALQSPPHPCLPLSISLPLWLYFALFLSLLLPEHDFASSSLSLSLCLPLVLHFCLHPPFIFGAFWFCLIFLSAFAFHSSLSFHLPDPERLVSRKNTSSNSSSSIYQKGLESDFI